jgi:hypothetical protein
MKSTSKMNEGGETGNLVDPKTGELERTNREDLYREQMWGKGLGNGGAQE